MDFSSEIKFTCAIENLKKSRRELRKLKRELAHAGASLMSYEASCGTGCGIDEGFEIARLLGYKGDLTQDDVAAWLRDKTQVRRAASPAGEEK